MAKQIEFQLEIGANLDFEVVLDTEQAGRTHRADIRASVGDVFVQLHFETGDGIGATGNAITLTKNATQTGALSLDADSAHWVIDIESVGATESDVRREARGLVLVTRDITRLTEPTAAANASKLLTFSLTDGQELSEGEQELVREKIGATGGVTDAVRESMPSRQISSSVNASPNRRHAWQATSPPDPAQVNGDGGINYLECASMESPRELFAPWSTNATIYPSNQQPAEWGSNYVISMGTVPQLGKRAMCPRWEHNWYGGYEMYTECSHENWSQFRRLGAWCNVPNASDGPVQAGFCAHAFSITRPISGVAMFSMTNGALDFYLLDDITSAELSRLGVTMLPNGAGASIFLTAQDGATEPKLQIDNVQHGSFQGFADFDKRASISISSRIWKWLLPVKHALIQAVDIAAGMVPGTMGINSAGRTVVSDINTIFHTVARTSPEFVFGNGVDAFFVFDHNFYDGVAGFAIQEVATGVLGVPAGWTIVAESTSRVSITCVTPPLAHKIRFFN